MKNIPKIIYLQIEDEAADSKDFNELETSWCADKINDNDIEYRLSKDVEKLEQLNAEMLEFLKFLDEEYSHETEDLEKLKSLIKKAESLK